MALKGQRFSNPNNNQVIIFGLSTVVTVVGLLTIEGPVIIRVGGPSKFLGFVFFIVLKCGCKTVKYIDQSNNGSLHVIEFNTSRLITDWSVPNMN